MPKQIIHLIAVARPNFIKVAPLYHALKDLDWCEAKIVHTGQHYDVNMSGDLKKGECPPLWDEKTAGRAIAMLKARLEK